MRRLGETRRLGAARTDGGAHDADAALEPGGLRRRARPRPALGVHGRVVEGGRALAQGLVQRRGRLLRVLARQAVHDARLARPRRHDLDHRLQHGRALLAARLVAQVGPVEAGLKHARVGRRGGRCAGAGAGALCVQTPAALGTGIDGARPARQDVPQAQARRVPLQQRRHAQAAQHVCDDGRGGGGREGHDGHAREGAAQRLADQLVVGPAERKRGTWGGEEKQFPGGAALGVGARVRRGARWAGSRVQARRGTHRKSWPSCGRSEEGDRQGQAKGRVREKLAEEGGKRVETCGANCGLPR